MSDSHVSERDAYEPPVVQVLGTLAELTQGADTGGTADNTLFTLITS